MLDDYPPPDLFRESAPRRVLSATQRTATATAIASFEMKTCGALTTSTASLSASVALPDAASFKASAGAATPDPAAALMFSPGAGADMPIGDDDAEETGYDEVCLRFPFGALTREDNPGLDFSTPRRDRPALF